MVLMVVEADVFIKLAPSEERELASASKEYAFRVFFRLS
jgi:hypothetical protein